MAVTAVPPGQPPIGPDIIQITIEEEMRRSYLDYAMSVIVARALPDVRDGLKPVHRRILYSMQVNGNLWNRGYRKSARITGDVMGKYHPHGDLAIYDAMVRLAQDFSMRLPLVDGQGNFGSMDGDPPAANRYTEARLARVADALLDDLDNDTVDFQPNYDETEREPKVLPAGFPNLLVNGAQGIAVGMATNIPPHNLGEVIDACCAYLEDRAITVEGLMEYVPAPDFPTGGIIIGRAGTHAAFKTGRGAVVLRAKSHVEEIRKDRDGIVFTEMPYQVNKAKLQERIAECVRDKLVEGIADLRDESDRDGVRLVVELKRDADPDIVLNQLYRHTALQTSFGVNMLALNAGRPEQMTLRDIIVAFIAFREEVITRRTTFLLGKARDRAHILVGLLIAVANIDEIIALIRAAADPGAAREGLLGQRWPTGDITPLLALVGEEAAGEGGTYQLTDAQARAILDLRLQRLTGLERDKIAEELQELVAEIAGHLEILRSPEKLIEMLRGELIAIKEQFANPRRTSIEDVEFEADIEALIQREDMVVTVSHAGYIKRVPLSTFRAQNRGGKGRAGMALREEDFLSQVFVASTLDPVLFFTSSGRVYKLKVYRLPLGTPQARGRPMINLLPNLVEGETISTIMPLPEDEESWSGLTVMFATAAGYVRRNALSDFVDVRSNGKIAMKFEGEDADDRLIAVAPCSEANDVLLATRNGKAIRFSVDDVRVFTGRSSVGVRGIRLLGDDTMISMSILRHEAVEPEVRNAYQKLATERRKQAGEEAEINGNGDHSPEADDTETEGQGEATISEEVFADLAAREEFVLSVTEKGFGVRGSAYGYRITGRGGQGINNMDLSRRGDAVVAVFPVGHNDQIMLVTDGGMVIRCPVDNIRIARRGSVGVVIFRVGDGERVVSVARLPEVAGENGDAESEEGDEN